MIGIFGGGGFIGRNLSRHFQQNHIQYMTFDRIDADGGDQIVIDFLDPATYEAHIAGLDAVVLLISASVPGTFVDNMPGEIENNILPYSRFFKAINNSAIKKVVFLSSGGTVYGIPQEDYVKESHTKAPINPYGCGKLIIETMIRHHSIYAPWSYTILRPSNPVGYGQSPSKGQGVIATAVHAAVNDKVMEIWGDGSVVRDYFDIRDLCAAIEQSLTNPEAHNETFNVGAARGYSVNEVLAEVERVTKRSIKRTYCSGRAIDVGRNVLDTGKIEAELGWRRTYELADTIKSLMS